MESVLLTGAYGFLGMNISPLLSQYYNLSTIGLASGNDYITDLRRDIPSFSLRFDIVVHTAGKAHVVPKTEVDTADFFEINFHGTQNLCKALEKVGVPKAFIFISTVAVYGLEAGTDITEDSPLNGKSPYALSKIATERYLTDWCDKHNVILSILRPALIIGENPPGNLGKMIIGIKRGFYCRIAGGQARKSMVSTQNIAEIIPLVVEKGGVYNVCGSYHPTVRELECCIAEKIGGRYIISVPYWLARLMAYTGDILGVKVFNSMKLNKIVSTLTFSSEKAYKLLGWRTDDILHDLKI